MNYANMIEEKNLKKGFIVATLISTVIGTFTASMNLNDKIQEKREKKKQAKLDGQQSDDIKRLEEQIQKLEAGESVNTDTTEKGKDRSDDKSSGRSSSRSSHGSRRRMRRVRDSFYEDDAAYFAYNAGRSRAMIAQTYEDNLLRLGSRYARGDLVTENMLQAQIIKLQQTVIQVLQDALYNGRSLSEDDMRRLVAAQNAARDGSIEALQAQYERMRPTAMNKSRTWDIAEGRGAPPPLLEPCLTRKAIQLIPNSPPRSPQFPPQRVKSLPASPVPDLYCRYSEQLQTSSCLQLHSAFGPNGSRRCPSCRVDLDVDTRDVWVFSHYIPAGKNGNGARSCDYSMSARFVAKCHVPDGRFACLLCSKYRERDCICRDIEALLKHIGTAHTTEEFEGEIDIMRMKEGSVEILKEHEKQLVLA